MITKHFAHYFTPHRFKIAVVDHGKVIEWEAGPNRSILLNAPAGAYIKQADHAPVSSGAEGPMRQPSSPPLSADDLMDAAAAAAAAPGAAHVPPPVSQQQLQCSVDAEAWHRQQTQEHDMALGAQSDSARHQHRFDHSARGRGSGGRGRGYTIAESSGSDLARLLGVIDSDEEDSAFDEDGRPRSQGLHAGPPTPAANGAPIHHASGGNGLSPPLVTGDDVTAALNNILSYPASAGNGNGKAHLSNDPALAFDPMAVISSDNGSAASDSSGSDGEAAAVPPQPIRVVSQAIGTPLSGPSSPPVASAVGRPSSPLPSAPATLADTTAGGDFIAVLNWGSACCNHALYRPLVLQTTTDGHLLNPRSAQLLSSRTAAVFVTVPYMATQPGQHIVITGSAPQLGAWNPSKGLRLNWGPGNRWTGHADLPLHATDMKVVVCNEHGTPVAWEPGADRHVDLPTLVARSSHTGAADVHLTCVWGQGRVTAAICIPKDAPAEEEASAASHAGPATVDGASAVSLGSGLAKATTADSTSDSLVRVLSLLLAGVGALKQQREEAASVSALGGLTWGDSLPTAYYSAEDREARRRELARREEERAAKEQLLASLQRSVEGKQREVDELAERLAEARAAPPGPPGRGGRGGGGGGGGPGGG